MRFYRFFIPRLNLSVILALIFTFIFMDITIVPKIIEEKIRLSSEFRLPISFTQGELRAFINSVNRDPSPKIILLGDSIINGGGVKDNQETISAYLQKYTPDYHVYNLGLSGAAPGDTFFVAKSLNISNKDIVIYDLNIGHYMNPPVVHKKKTATLTDNTFHGMPLEKDFKLPPNQLEDRLQLLVSENWKLYGYREVIKKWINEDLFHKWDVPQDVNYDPWYTTDWTEKTKGAAKRGGTPVSKSDPALLATEYLIQEVKEKGGRILIFNIPLNQEMNEKYHTIDREGYNQEIQFFSEIVRKDGASFKDYEKLVPSPYFTDSLHPTKGGNEIIAKKLNDDLSPWLNRKEVSK